MTENSGDAHTYYVENIGNKEIFSKEYKKERTEKIALEIYHLLHHYMSTKNKDAYFGDTILDGTIIDNRNISILDLDFQWIYEATNTKNKEEILITNPTYIPGKTLKDYEDQLWKEKTQQICDAITRYIEMISKVKFIDMYGVVPINVKIHIKNNTAELIVTDISCNIKNFFHCEKNAVILDNLFKEDRKEK